MYHIHLKGFLSDSKALPLLNNGGRIINLSSIAARISYPGNSAYSMMKGGVDVSPEIWHFELGPRGIHGQLHCAGSGLWRKHHARIHPK
jgi:NAD(P)-dependent dehydrogenase (short-subunit alcohol dehydrogenase family)